LKRIDSPGIEGSQPALAVSILCSGKQISIYLSVLVINTLKPERSATWKVVGEVCCLKTSYCMFTHHQISGVFKTLSSSNNLSQIPYHNIFETYWLLKRIRNAFQSCVDAKIQWIIIKRSVLLKEKLENLKQHEIFTRFTQTVFDTFQLKYFRNETVFRRID
jgi:hypothetical protein